MNIVLLDVVPGSDEWKAGRVGRFNASDAAAMLGLPGAHETRSELLARLATGTEKEFSNFVQERVIDPGHEFEAHARALAEEIIAAEGEAMPELYPVVLACAKGEELPMSASLDGRIMNQRITWEHKSLNKELAASLAVGIIPEKYHPQMEQGFILSPKSERCLFMASNGDKESMVWVWYYPNHELRERIIAGWRVLKRDRDNYVAPEVIPAAVAAPTEGLPAVTIQMVGGIEIRDNLKVFGNALNSFLERMPKQPETDDDFATLDDAVKRLKAAEETLDAAENGALAQATDIDTMRRTVAMYRDQARAARLAFTSLVKEAKEARKANIIRAAADKLDEIIRKIRAEFAGYGPEYKADFQGAVRGLKTLKSYQDAVNTVLANETARLEISADGMRTNLSTYGELAQGYESLFPDLMQTLIAKPADDFKAAVTARIATHKQRIEAEAEAARERIRQQEEAKAAAKAEEALRIERERIQREERIAQEQAPAPKTPTTDEVIQAVCPSAIAQAFAPQPAPTTAPIAAQHVNGKTMKLGEICEALGFTVTANFLARLGFEPCGNEGAAKLYRVADFTRICAALIDHINTASATAIKAA